MPTLTRQNDALQDSSTERMRRRREWVTEVLSAWEMASGAQFDVKRIPLFVSELDLGGFTYAQGLAARAWILRGRPARFGQVTLADFFPTREMLDEIGYDPRTADQVKKAHDDAVRSAGYAQGFEAGIMHEHAELQKWRRDILHRLGRDRVSPDGED